MTRRLALVIVSVVIATLVLAGGGTFALAVLRARASTEADLRAQTTDFATNIGEFLDVGTPVDTPEAQQQLRNRVRLLARLRTVLPVDDVTVIIGNKAGEFDLAELPAGVTLAPADLVALAAGSTVSGAERRLAFAASQSSAPTGRSFLVVATRRIDAGLGGAVRLWLWAGAATILLGLGAAYLLGRRLGRPVREAANAAHEIAGGNLSARVPAPAQGDHDELAELQRGINHMAEHLERNRTLEQQFLLSVSHDLRTPLTSIRGYSEAIEDGTVDPQKAAAVIRSESRRLERLVADLLDLAKLQSKSFTFHNVTMDLAAAVHTATDGAAGSSGDVTFHAVTSGAVHATADPDRVAQILANLIENASKYARTSVLVSCRAEFGRAVVTVDDDGPGIPALDLPHVFDRLYVAGRQPERKESSSGLGLAIVKELVETMGGEVIAGNAPTGGARLWFWLPAATVAP